MFTRVVALLVGLSLVVSIGVWFAVTSDRWPGDNRDRVAGLVFSVNKALGRWLLAHAEPSPCTLPFQPSTVPLTTAEIAEATAAFEKAQGPMPRDRLGVGMAKVRPGPLGRSVDVSVGGGGGGMSSGMSSGGFASGSGGGACSTGGSRGG